MTQLRQRQVLHMKLSRGGSMYGYEILAPDNTVIATKSVRRATSKDKWSTIYLFGEQELATAEELINAYKAKLETKRRDEEWERAKP